MPFWTKMWTVATATVTLALLTGSQAGAAGRTQAPAWGTVRSPNRGDLDNALLGVSAVAPSDAWAVGEFNPGVPPTVTGLSCSYG